MSYRAYQGANGWYVAWESRDGSHVQPLHAPQGWSRERAMREAEEATELDRIERHEEDRADAAEYDRRGA